MRGLDAFSYNRKQENDCGCSIGGPAASDGVLGTAPIGSEDERPRTETRKSGKNFKNNRKEHRARRCSHRQ